MRKSVAGRPVVGGIASAARIPVPREAGLRFDRRVVGRRADGGALSGRLQGKWAMVIRSSPSSCSAKPQRLPDVCGADAHLPSGPWFEVRGCGASGRRVLRWRARRRFPVTSKCFRCGRRRRPDGQRARIVVGMRGSFPRRARRHAPSIEPGGEACGPRGTATDSLRMRAACRARIASPARTAEPNGTGRHSRPKAALEAVAAVPMTASRIRSRGTPPVRKAETHRRCSTVCVRRVQTPPMLSRAISMDCFVGLPNRPQPVEDYGRVPIA